MWLGPVCAAPLVQELDENFDGSCDSEKGEEDVSYLQIKHETLVWDHEHEHDDEDEIGHLHGDHHHGHDHTVPAEPDSTIPPYIFCT